MGMKALDHRVQSLEAALQAQKAAYEAMKDVFEGLVNGAHSPKQQSVQVEDDVVYTIMPQSDCSESQFNPNDQF